MRDDYQDLTFIRPAAEAYAALFWLLGAVVCALMGLYGDYGIRFMLLAAPPQLAFSIMRLVQAFGVWHDRALLVQEPALNYTVEDLIRIQQKNPTQVFLGRGFNWHIGHTQRAYVYQSKKPNEITPPEWYLKARSAMGLDASQLLRRLMKGECWLHGLGAKEEVDCFGDLEGRFGHRTVAGSTGTGKGRILALDVVAAVVRGEAILYLDPKRDTNMEDLIWATLTLLKQTYRWNYFAPAFPSCSVRLNPLKNFTLDSQLATRVSDLMKSGGESEQFRQFAWRALNAIVEALLLQSRAPTLVLLRQFLEGDMADVLVRAATAYFNRFPAYKAAVVALRSSHTDAAKFAQALTRYYNEKVVHENPNQTINTLINIAEHDRAHWSKLITNVLPILMILTSGNLREMLSPDPNSDDPRPIVDISQIARRGDILYCNLSSLADNMMGSAIGSLLISDAISVVADRYFYQKGALIPFNIYMDEGYEIVNESAVRMMSKCRGALVAVTLAFQVSADLAVKLGSVDHAMQFFGNANTSTVARVADAQSQMMLSERYGEVDITSISGNVMTSAVSLNEAYDFTTSYGKSENSTRSPFISPKMLGSLRDLHHFTALPGGVLYKLRVPYVQVPDHLKFKLVPVNDDLFGDLPPLESLMSTRIQAVMGEAA